MKIKFEQFALSLVGLVVISVVAAALFAPPQAATSAFAPSRSGQSAGFASAVTGALGGVGAESASSSRALAAAFRKLGYDFDAVAAGHKPVPRLFLDKMPHDLASVREVEHKKNLFLQTVLPLVLEVNKEISADRKRLYGLWDRLSMGKKPDAADQLWISGLSGKYQVKRGDLDALLERTDLIPVSLALAQAAIESGWGTSRFVREGNALFGQWTTGEEGLVPLRRDTDKRHKIQTFKTLMDSVRSYAHNLNTHPAYREFRKRRAALRRRDLPLAGEALVEGLKRYSELGPDYVATLRSVIEANGLERLNGVRFVYPHSKIKVRTAPEADSSKDA